MNLQIQLVSINTLMRMRGSELSAVEQISIHNFPAGSIVMSGHESADSLTPDHAVMHSAESSPDELNSKKARVMFMDDEILISMTTGQILSRAGFDVSLAYNGAEAVDIYKRAISDENPFSLIILDLNVPGGMGGLETLRTILEINPAAKAIITSGYLNDDIMSNYNAYGFAAVLPKPFSTQDLIEIVSNNLYAAER